MNKASLNVIMFDDDEPASSTQKDIRNMQTSKAKVSQNIANQYEVI